MAGILLRRAERRVFRARAREAGRIDVPTICIYEVFKLVLARASESDALCAVAQMRQGTVVDLHSALAIEAARLSIALRLPMPESIILATARLNEAVLWTQDADFEGLEGVKYRPKRRR